MFKKLLASCLVLSLTAGSAFADQRPRHGNYKRYSHYQSRPQYKGELKGIYKGELPPLTKPAPPPSDFPCRTATFIPGPYLGFSPGLVNNYNRTSSVFRAFQGTLFGGFALLNENFYLAGEIFGGAGAQIQNYRHDFNRNGNPIGLKTTWGAGLSILPGLILADTLMGYLRIGAVKTHFKDIAQTATGGQAGIGIEGTVSENWDLRAEYIYTFYQSLTGLGAPRSDSFHFGVLYKFWG